LLCGVESRDTHTCHVREKRSPRQIGKCQDLAIVQLAAGYLNKYESHRGRGKLPSQQMSELSHSVIPPTTNRSLGVLGVLGPAPHFDTTTQVSTTHESRRLVPSDPSEQPNMDGSTSNEESLVLRRPWWRRIVSDLRERHKRQRPITESPSVRQSILAIIKSSREPTHSPLLSQLLPTCERSLCRVERLAHLHSLVRECL
jgi:hypothetical protein